MTRMSKQGERRAKNPKRSRLPQPKTGPKKDNLKEGFKVHDNSLEGDFAQKAFIPLVRGKKQ